jgi:uncharacterized protein YidB (DUF937 family)
MGLMDILNGMQNGPKGQRQPTPPGQSGGMSPIMMALLGLLAYKAVKGMTGSSAPAGTPQSPQSLPPGTRTADSGGGGLGDLLGGMLNGPRGNPGGAPQPLPPSARTGAPGGGGLGDILGSILGGGQPQPGGMPRGAPPAGGGLGGPGGGGLGSVLGGLLGGAAAGSVLNGGLGQVLQDLQRSGQGRTAQSWIGRGANEDIAPDDLANALGADTISALAQQTGMSRGDLLAGLSQSLPDFVDQLTPDGRLPTDDEASRW